MRAFQIKVVEEAGDFPHQGPDGRFPVSSERRRLTVTGQVNENKFALLGQRAADHVPGLSPVPKAMEEHKRRPRSDSLKGQPHVDLPPRRPTGSGDPAV